jgi:hypothetical protein
MAATTLGHVSGVISTPPIKGMCRNSNMRPTAHAAVSRMWSLWNGKTKEGNSQMKAGNSQTKTEKSNESRAEYPRKYTEASMCESIKTKVRGSISYLIFQSRVQRVGRSRKGSQGTKYLMKSGLKE